jgi:phospholipid/cholesterol/gamma-HCH transport system substrate-binding protein
MKKATRKQKLAVGGFVVGMILLMVTAILFFGDDLTFFKHSSRYFAGFKNTAGLHVGAALQMGGVDVGTVEAIAIDTTGKTPRILLTLMIFSPHDKLIKADTEVSMNTQGMLGDKLLTLSTGSAAAPALPAGSFLQTRESMEMSEVVSQSVDIIATINSTAEKIDLFVDSLPSGAAMKGSTADFQASALALKSLLVSLNGKGSALRTLSDPALAVSIGVTVASLEHAAQRLDSVATKIDSGKGTIGALVNDSSLYDDMRTLMGRANRSKAAKFIIKQMLHESDGSSKIIEEGSAK